MRNRDCLVALSQLTDASVQDSRGEAVGIVEDLVLDTGDNRIAYVSLMLHVEGDPEHYRVTIPWSAISIDTGSRSIVRVAVRNATLRRIARKKQAS